MSRGPDIYKGWTIDYQWPPIPIRDFDWSATGPNYDVDYKGEEEGYVSNGECVYASTREGVIAEIDRYIEEHKDEQPAF